MDLFRVFVTWLINVVNLVVFIVTLGRRNVHEGTYIPFLNLWYNWNQDFHVKPQKFVYASGLEEVVRVVKEAKNLRVVGGGHSFNSSPLCDDVMLSLDKLNNIIEIDHDRHRVRTQAGIRLRDFLSYIENVGLSLPTIGVIDAQSIGGLIATDVHGAAVEQGSISDVLISLTLVDGNGKIRILHKGKDEAFTAVTGGIGALGVVVEAEIQCVPFYRVSKQTFVVERDEVENDIMATMQQHDHVILTYMAGAKVTLCRMDTLNQTTAALNKYCSLIYFIQDVNDFIITAFTMGVARVLRQTKFFANISYSAMRKYMGSNIVGPAGRSFVRHLYYRHSEIEYGVPVEHFKQCLDKVLQYLEDGNFFTIMVVRYTSATVSLIAPAGGRDTVFFNLNACSSYGADETFAKLAEIFQEFDGRPHLGKWTPFTIDKMRKVYGDRYDKFIQYRNEFDPSGKFHNAFLSQVLPSPSIASNLPAQ